MENNEWDLKKEYNKLKVKHLLPEYSKLSEDFDIEKLSDKETDFLSREIRRVINEKISAYLHLLENLINPNSPPIFIMTVLRKISSEEREVIKELYKKLSLIQLKVMKLDTIYSEKEEINFIKESFKEWQEHKKAIYDLISSFDSKFIDNSSSIERGYFG